MISGFTRSVLEATEKIPSGRVTTYGEIAGYLRARSPRAVGGALKRNPFPVRIPCHRVVMRDGRIGGYSGPGGKAAKIRLLREEGVGIKNERVEELKEVYFSFQSGEH